VVPSRLDTLSNFLSELMPISLSNNCKLILWIRLRKWEEERARAEESMFNNNYTIENKSELRRKLVFLGLIFVFLSLISILIGTSVAKSNSDQLESSSNPKPQQSNPSPQVTNDLTKSSLSESSESEPIFIPAFNSRQERLQANYPQQPTGEQRAEEEKEVVTRVSPQMPTSTNDKGQLPIKSYQGDNTRLAVVNKQSYPTLQGNWTVRFHTKGRADLKIEPVNGTEWSQEIREDSDLKFESLRCGSRKLDYQWINDDNDRQPYLLVENYSCDWMSYETSEVLTIGKHHLKISYGDSVAYVHNYANSNPGVLVTQYETGTTSNAATEGELDRYFLQNEVEGRVIHDDIDCEDGAEGNGCNLFDDGDSYATCAVGSIYAPTSGTYDFATDSDDASDVYIGGDSVDCAHPDGTKVTSWYSGHGDCDCWDHSGSISLDEGFHKVMYRQEEGSGGADWILGWQKPGDSSYSKIPSSYLSYQEEDRVIYDSAPGFSGWSSTPEYNCNGFHMMGGYNNFGTGASTQKTINNLPAGNYIIRFNYYFGDSWDGESGRLFFEGNQVWSQSCTGSCYNTKDVCGGSWSDGIDSPEFSVVVNHDGGDATLEFDSTLNQDASDEWWGVNNIRVIAMDFARTTGSGETQGFETYNDNDNANVIPGWYEGSDCGTCRVETSRGHGGGSSFYQDASSSNDDWQDVLRKDFSPSLKGKVTVSYWYWEQSSPNWDGNLWVRACDGTNLAGIGTENPQFEWKTTSSTGTNNPGNDYQDWTRATMYIDLDAGSVTFDWWQEGGGESWTTTQSIPSGKEICTMGVGPGGEWYIDDIYVQATSHRCDVDDMDVQLRAPGGSTGSWYDLDHTGSDSGSCGSTPEVTETYDRDYYYNIDCSESGNYDARVRSHSEGEGGSYYWEYSDWFNNIYNCDCISNGAASAGSTWVEGQDLHWADGSHECWVDGANLVDSGSPGQPGNWWIEGDYMHWVDESDDERRYRGFLYDGSPGGPSGSVWLEDNHIHYIDADGDERVASGIQ